MGLAVCVECGTEGYYAEQAAASSPPGLFSTTSSEAAPHFSKKSHCEEAPAFNKERGFFCPFKLTGVRSDALRTDNK